MEPEVIAAAIAGLVGLVEGGRTYMRRKRKRDASAFPAVLDSVHRIYHELNALLSTTQAHRVAIMRAEDSGEVPTVGKDLYSSIVYESFKERLGSEREKWQRQPLDDAYVSILLRAVTDGAAVVLVEDMQPGALRDRYTSSGVSWAECHPLVAWPGEFFYMKLQYASRFTPDAFHRDSVRVAVTNVRRILERGRPSLPRSQRFGHGTSADLYRALDVTPDR
jgi:hypothetical protein